MASSTAPASQLSVACPSATACSSKRLQQQQQASSSSTALLTALDTIQGSFTPATGTSASGDIGTDITNLFNAYTQLESNPTSNPLRQQVLATASTLAGDVSNVANSLGQQQISLDQSATSVASQVNAITTSLAQVNVQIQALSPRSDAGTLEDQRQADLSALSQLIGVNQITTENNGLSVTTASGQLLVSEGDSRAHHHRHLRRSHPLLYRYRRHYQRARLGWRLDRWTAYRP